MDKDQLLALLNNHHEDSWVERKSEGVAPDELRQTVCAFANSVPEGRPGVLFIGVHDKTGELIGVSNADKLQKRVRRAAEDCYPSIECRTEVLTVSDKAVLAVVVPFSTLRPHFSGPAYLRIGSESVKASPQQYEELILSRCDKAREILRHKNDLFTVWSLGYKLGNNNSRPVNESYEEVRECRLERCTGHLVSLRDIASDKTFSDPLPHVTIDYDHEKRRMLLRVTLT